MNEMMKKKMRIDGSYTLSRPTGPNEVLTMFETAWHATTALVHLQKKSVRKTVMAREGECARERERDVTVLSADVLAGLSFAGDVRSLIYKRHCEVV
jgi:hypothetical protein